jgi:uncharacterized phage infection (PIP) family protein YhgE
MPIGIKLVKNSVNRVGQLVKNGKRFIGLKMNQAEKGLGGAKTILRKADNTLIKINDGLQYANSLGGNIPIIRDVVGGLSGSVNLLSKGVSKLDRATDRAVGNIQIGRNKIEKFNQRKQQIQENENNSEETNDFS